MEAAYRPEARPWEWADRLAVLRLHLGEPAKARAAWLAATANAPAAPRLARIAATYLVEGDFDTSRKYYRQAIAADPNSFEAHYGLASLELDAGHAPEATEQALQAQQAAVSEHARLAARSILDVALPYATDKGP
jgi:tetratricopeptide (TPR) repeat protein